jgi:uncharacterized membrane protein YeaQ/YmgE (transglycosylase-associated protein family)
MEWIIGIIGGALGGVGSGAAVKKNTLGPVVNGILGAIGGAGGSAIIQAVLAGAPVSTSARSPATSSAAALRVRSSPPSSV